MFNYAGILPDHVFDNLTYNNAGGLSYAVDPTTRLLRFLILGSESGTYYSSSKKLTEENARNIIQMIKVQSTSNGHFNILANCISVSQDGRASKNDPAIFVLALIIKYSPSKELKLAAIKSIHSICRTGTHLFIFMQYLKDLKVGFGRALRAGIAKWYNMPDRALQYQIMKYKKRNGWSHRDVLRLCHAPHTSVKAYAATNERSILDVLYIADPEGYVAGCGIAERTDSIDKLIQVIRENGLTWEMIPTRFLNEAPVWSELLNKMPMEAMIRNLGKMSSLTGFWKNEENLLNSSKKLTTLSEIRSSKIHPIKILSAIGVYSQGRGDKGMLRWEVNPIILESLELAFQLSFENVEPTGKRILIGLDVSGSMQRNKIAGTGLNAAMASSALTFLTAKIEKCVNIVAFSHNLVEIGLAPDLTLKNFILGCQKIPFGATRCAAPIEYALGNKIPVDCFIIMTDNETNYGPNPSTVLRTYREVMGINAKLIVVGMTATEFSIADPNDRGMLDCVGFDTSTPKIISEFIKGEF